MNMKFAALASLGTLALMVAAPSAQAADNGFYLGAGITQTEFDVDDVGSGELDDNSFKLIAGFRPLDWLAVEANYIDLGSDAGLDTSAVTLSALALAEVGIVDFYARLGIARWDADLDTGIGDFSDEGWEPTYGVGVGVHFGSIGVRAEYEMFNAKLFESEADLDTDVSTLSLSFTYTFL
jgi:hypothetical protein